MRGRAIGLAALVALFVPLSSVSAQTVRAIPMQTVFVTYVGNTAHWTDPAVTGPKLVTQANTFWHGPDGSWGAITYTNAGTLGWLDTAVTTTGSCPAGAISQAVTTAYGIAPSGTTRHIVLPPGTPCNSQGGGNTFWTVGGGALEHEAGHTLGLGHAKADFPDGSVQEYGPYDVMGNSVYGGAIHVASRQTLGLYSSTFQLATVTTSQDVTLQFVATMTPGIKGLVATKLISGPFASFNVPVLTAEFRGGDYLSTGVIIHNASGDLQWMDNTQQNFWRLLVGKTWCVAGYNVCITNVSQTSTTATVHVEFAEAVSPVNHVR